MYRVDDATKTSYKTDSVHKELEIRFPDKNITLSNESIIAQSLSLTESIESSQNLSFTGCVAACLKFQCVDIVTDIEGEYIEVDIKTLVDDSTDPPTYTTTIPLFRGYVDKVGNPNSEQRTMEVTAYDALYSKINNVDVTDWYNGLTFPMSIKSFRNSFFQRVGVQQVADALPNDSRNITKSLQDKTINGSTIIKAICQINGRFGRIGRTGKFEYVHLVIGTEALYPREDLYPDDDVYPSAENALDNVSKAHFSSAKFENYRVQPIDKVQLVKKDGSLVEDGEGDNAFTVSNNFIVWGLVKNSASETADPVKTATINLYNTVYGLWYVPAEIQCVGLPYVECGDFVSITTRREVVRIYVLHRTLTGIQGLKDSFNAQGDKKQPVYTPSVKAKISANTHAITSEVTRATGAESGLSTRINNEAATRQEQINAVNVRCNNLVAETARISNLVADTINTVNLHAQRITAAEANITTLNAKIINVEQVVATKVTASQVEAIVSSSLRTYSGALNCNSITVGGSTFTYGRTINLFSSDGSYTGQAVVLSRSN